jgi:hypothetical protein
MHFSKPSKADENKISYVACSPRLFPYTHTLHPVITGKKAGEMTQQIKTSSTSTKGCSCGIKLEGVSMTTTHFTVIILTAGLVSQNKLYLLYF